MEYAAGRLVMEKISGITYPCREVYEEGAVLLSGMDDGKLDARLLLEHFCGIPTHRLLADPETPVSASSKKDFLEGIRRRAAREPLAYITGEQSFMGLPFVVSSDVLIPEQDTENLVEEALRLLEDGSRILDLCTGSGCILLSLLHYSNGCVGVGTDLSGKALAIAEQNAAALGLTGQAVWKEGDLFEALRPDRNRFEKDLSGVQHPDRNRFGENLYGAPQSLQAAADAGKPGKFDLIISNPPYIPSAVIETLAPEVRCAEPRLALDGGADGLDFYRRIIAEAPGYLTIGGRLMLEIGYDQADAVSALLQDAGYYGIEILQDYGGNDRIATAVRSMRQGAESI